MLLFSHPTFDCTVRHTARAVSRAGLLGELWTCLTAPDRFELQRVPAGSLVDPPDAGAAGASGATVPEPSPIGDPSAAWAAASSLDRAMSVRLENDQFSGVYAYEGGADESFRTAARHGLLRIYDLPLGHWRSRHDILAEEAAREPEWATTIAFGDEAAAARTRSELENADLVLVGSTFALRMTEQTADIPAALAIVPPTAPCPAVLPPPERNPAASTSCLRVLFAGPLSQRTGLSYLFRACRELGSSVALTVIGDVPAAECPPLIRELGGVRWLPRGTAESLRLEMAGHDVFVFPAVYDSHAQLLLEAMSMGLPVVATPHSAAPDLIRDGEEGFIVPVRSTTGIMEKLDLLRRDPARREQMSRCARQRAASHTWDRFEQIVAASVASALGRR